MPRVANWAVCVGIVFGATGMVACATEDEENPGSETGDEFGEEGEGVIDSPILSRSETDDPDALVPQALDVDNVEDFIDVRGVGDAAWTGTHESPARPAQFDRGLRDFDPTGTAYRGHLSFINWETVVGSTCTKWHAPYVRGRSYSFLSRAENLTQAYEHGFNLVALSNNHTRDCHDDGGEIGSSRLTFAETTRVSEGKNWLWHGVSATEEEERKPVIGTFEIHGRQVRVGFASGYTGRASCPLATCKGEIEATMRALADADVDLRILSLHSMGKNDQLELAQIGVRFVEQYSGDVVFGSGPHVWARVQVARKPNGQAGVVFESLGNFIHPGVGVQARNIIGRALFDKQTLALRQVQVVPISGAGARVNFNTNANLDDPSLVGNIRFTRSGAIKGGYVNIRER